MSKFDFLDRFHKEQKLDVDRVALREFASEIGGNIVTTSAGTYLEIVTEFTTKFLHGVKALQTLLEKRAVSLDCFETTSGNGNIDIEQFVFVDAETTGLSTTAGTVAFLIGVGYVEGDCFKVHQFFLPDYADEPPMLEAVADLVDGKTVVVSFNGKAFDLPLLEARYVLQRMTTPFAGMRHLDLLHVSRRFWRGRFVDNTLQTLEKELLSVYRYNDTPGYLIPQLFFDYLRTGEPEPLAGVMLHNRLDIVTLLFLMNTVQTYLEDAPRFDYYSPLDALMIAKHLTRKGEIEAAVEVASRQFSSKMKHETELSLAVHLYRAQKRLGKHEEALATVMFLRQAKGETKLYALEEAAKILERRLRDYPQASQLVLEALEYLDSPLADLPPKRLSAWYDALQKRRQRLLKRLT
jgi:uncharacterized protein YprB with RNaseH-like and TPR domain